MPRLWLALPSVLFLGTLVHAQPADPKLEELLAQWEKAMTGVQSLVAEGTRTSINKAFGTTEVYEGTVKFLKSNVPGQMSRASLEMYKKGRPEVFEKYICSGTHLYEYVPSSMLIRIHEIPKGQVDDNLVSLVFGTKSAEVKNRYQISYVPPLPEDKAYQYLRVVPKLATDKAEFSEARIALSNGTFLPRQLWFQEPNGNVMIWDFPKVVNNADLRPTDFGQPPLPREWKWVSAGQK